MHAYTYARQRHATTNYIKRDFSTAKTARAGKPAKMLLNENRPTVADAVTEFDEETENRKETDTTGISVTDMSVL